MADSNAKRQISLFTYYYCSGLDYFRLYDDPATLPDTWETAPGSYKIINPDPQGTPGAIRLSNKGGILELSYKVPRWHSETGKLYLNPISKTEAVTTGIGRSSGETMRIIDIDAEKGLAFWGYKMKKQK